MLHRATPEVNLLSSIIRSLHQQHKGFSQKVIDLDITTDPVQFNRMGRPLEKAIQWTDAWHTMLEELVKRAGDSAGLV